MFKILVVEDDRDLNRSVDTFDISGFTIVRLINIKRPSELLQKKNSANITDPVCPELDFSGLRSRFLLCFDTLEWQRKKALLRLNPRIRLSPPTLKLKRRKADSRILRLPLRQNEGGGCPIFR